MSNFFSERMKEQLKIDAKALEEDRWPPFCDSMREYNATKMRRSRARAKLREAIKSLTWYARTQPEDQVKQVFQEEMVAQLVGAICGVHSKIEGRYNPEPLWQNVTYLEKREDPSYNDYLVDRRLLDIVERILEVLNGALSRILVPEEVKRVEEFMALSPVLEVLRKMDKILILQYMSKQKGFYDKK